jgi:hypothetical protein
VRPELWPDPDFKIQISKNTALLKKFSTLRDSPTSLNPLTRVVGLAPLTALFLLREPITYRFQLDYNWYLRTIVIQLTSLLSSTYLSSHFTQRGYIRGKGSIYALPDHNVSVVSRCVRTNIRLHSVRSGPYTAYTKEVQSSHCWSLTYVRKDVKLEVQRSKPAVPVRSPGLADASQSGWWRDLLNLSGETSLAPAGPIPLGWQG